MDVIIGFDPYRIVNEDDMDTTIEGAQPFTSSRLRPLFFPVLDDFTLDHENRAVNGNIYHLNGGWMLDHSGQQPPWPTMREPFPGDSGHFYRYRRPRFLSVLSDQEYQELYTRLLGSHATGKPLPRWELMTSACRVDNNRTHDVLYLMIRWFNPGAELPSDNSEQEVEWSWDDVVREHIISRRGGAVCKPKKHIRDDPQSSAAALVDDVFGICLAYRDKLKSPEVERFLRGEYYDSEYEENIRFSQQPWNSLLELAWDYTGGAFPSTGRLAQYRDRQKIAQSRLVWETCGKIIERLVSTNEWVFQAVFDEFGIDLVRDKREEREDMLSEATEYFHTSAARFMHWTLEELRDENDSCLRSGFISEYIGRQEGVALANQVLQRYTEMTKSLSPIPSPALQSGNPLPQIEPAHDPLPASKGNLPVTAPKSSHSKPSQKSSSESSGSSSSEKSGSEEGDSSSSEETASQQGDSR
ncbi:hypothetical protein Plec18167_005156 [Paecilomyces lecythidis]|uniref:Uncharacterized protein n=1 Tax=Paecilomyces lecythidis TaxID=3004212 RepID=A0ABR3XM75_9EURO